MSIQNVHKPTEMHVHCATHNQYTKVGIKMIEMMGFIDKTTISMNCIDQVPICLFYAHKLESFRSMNSHSSASVYRITKRGFTYSSWNCSDLNGYYWLTAYKMIGIHSLYSDLNAHAQWFLWSVYLRFFDEKSNYSD